MTSERPYVVLARDLDARPSDQIREPAWRGRSDAVGARAEPVRLYPQTGGGPETTLAAHLLGFVNREGRPVRHRAVLPGPARRHAATSSRAAGAAGKRSRTRPRSSRPACRCRPHPDDRRRPPARGGAGAARPRGSPTAPSVSAVVMDPYTGEIFAWATLPVLQRQRLPAIAAADPGRFVDPIVSRRLRARLGVQDAHRRRGARDGGRRRWRRRSTTPARCGSTAARRRSTTRTARAWAWMTFKDAIAYSRNVVAAKVALSLGRHDSGVRSVLTDVEPAGLRRDDRHRRRQRGRRPRAGPGHDAVAPDRPRERRVRPGRRGDSDAARAVATRRWSTAGAGAGRTSSGGRRRGDRAPRRARQGRDAKLSAHARRADAPRRSTRAATTATGR